jgi:nucleoside-diphosphate-sugar epimerase
MKQRILITGGSGFIGHALVKRLSARKDDDAVEVLAADYPVPVLPRTASAEVQYIAQLRRQRVAETVATATVDIRDAAAVSALVSEFQPSVVIHLAAVSVADTAAGDQELTQQVNVGGLRNMLSALAARGARLVFASSSFVYGDFEFPVADERHPLRPRGAYGVTKFEGEQLVRAAGALNGLQTVIVRPSAVYGPYDSNLRIVQALLEQARAGAPSTLHGADGVLDFTFVEDLATGLELAALHPRAPGRTFNLTAGKGRSLRELAEILRAHFPGHVVHEAPVSASKPKRGTLDIGHAQMVLGYQPATDLESGIAKYVDFYDSALDAKRALGAASPR